MDFELQRNLFNQALRHLCGLEAVLRRYIACLDKELLINTFQANGLEQQDNRPTQANSPFPENRPSTTALPITEPAVSYTNPSFFTRGEFKKGE